MLDGFLHGLAGAAAYAGAGPAADWVNRRFTRFPRAGQTGRAARAYGAAGLNAARNLAGDTGAALGGLLGTAAATAGSIAGGAYAQVRPTIGRAAGAAGRAMWGATRAGTGLGMRGAWGAAKFLPGASLQLAGAGITAAGTVGAGALGLAYGAQRLAYAAVGGQFVEWSPVAGKVAERIGLHTPGLTRRATGAIGIGMLGMGVAKGVQQYYQQHRWNLTEALATGAVEVERESFLGATGSLTIASSRRRPGLPPNAPGVGIDPHALALVADDLAIAASRIL